MADRQDGSKPAGAGRGGRGMPRWKKVTLTVFAFLFLAGAALKASSFFREKGGASGGQKVVTDQKNLTDGVRDDSGEAGFVAGRPSPSIEGERGPGEAEGEKKAIEDWSPILLKGSMSFFLGFCIGYALRTFFRISAVVIGLVALAIFGLSYAGFIQPDWTAMEEQFNRIVGNLREQAGGFKDFLAGSLPSAGLATAGLFTGFKR